MKTWLRISILYTVFLIVGCNTANNQQELEEEVNGEETQEDSDAEQTSADDDAIQEVEGEVENNEDFLAVEDEFTKEFLVDTDVEPGFHQMRGKLDGFEMVIPENGIISDLLHDIENDAIETLIFTFNNFSERKLHDVKLMYYKKIPRRSKTKLFKCL